MCSSQLTMPVTPPVTFTVRMVVRASRDQHGGLGCSVGIDGITGDMRSRKHAQTRPSPVPLALLLIDVLTTFQFPDGDAILQGALRMRDALMRLKARAREAGIPVMYVNDNFGDWRSEKEVLMGRCLRQRGRSL